MTSISKTVSAGVASGTATGAIAALAAMSLVPELGHPVTLLHFFHDLGFAIFFSLPVGPLAGACAGAFLAWRARRVISFRTLVAETVGLAGGIVGIATQLVIPVAWDLPWLRISIITVSCAAASAALSAWILKSLYWLSLAGPEINKNRIVAR
jgi:hypothetical protein